MQEGSPSLFKMIAVQLQFATGATIALINVFAVFFAREHFRQHARDEVHQPETRRQSSHLLRCCRGTRSQTRRRALSPAKPQSSCASADLPCLLRSLSPQAGHQAPTSASAAFTGLVTSATVERPFGDSTVSYKVARRSRSTPDLCRNSMETSPPLLFTPTRSACSPNSTLNFCSVNFATLTTGHMTSVTTRNSPEPVLPRHGSPARGLRNIGVLAPLLQVSEEMAVDSSAHLPQYHQGGTVVTEAPLLSFSDCKDPKLIARCVLLSCRDWCHKHDVVGRRRALGVTRLLLLGGFLRAVGLDVSVPVAEEAPPFVTLPRAFSVCGRSFREGVVDYGEAVQGCSRARQVLPQLCILQVLVDDGDLEVIRYLFVRECSVQPANSSHTPHQALCSCVVHDVKEHPCTSPKQSRIMSVTSPLPGLVPTLHQCTKAQACGGAVETWRLCRVSSLLRVSASSLLDASSISCIMSASHGTTVRHELESEV